MFPVSGWQLAGGSRWQASPLKRSTTCWPVRGCYCMLDNGVSAGWLCKVIACVTGSEAFEMIVGSLLLAGRDIGSHLCHRAGVVGCCCFLRRAFSHYRVVRWLRESMTSERRAQVGAGAGLRVKSRLRSGPASSWLFHLPGRALEPI